MTSVNNIILSGKLCVWQWITFSIVLETRGSKEKEAIRFGAVFETFVNSGFNLAILQLDGNTKYFIDMLQIWKMGLAKTVAPSFKNLSDK